MQVSVTITYLEMTDRGQFRPRYVDDPAVRLTQVLPPQPELNRRLYDEVGAAYAWFDKRSWTADQWQAYAKQPELTTWLLESAGELAGYFELHAQLPDSVEVAYLGLLPSFIGRGLGAHLVSAAIDQAWRLGPRRVWLHTCTLDHPHALANYQARGLKIYNTRTEQKELHWDRGSAEPT
jgi:GNAT superfamily N-acetyltransferase